MKTVTAIISHSIWKEMECSFSQLRLLGFSLHTEKYFRNVIKSNRNQIEFTMHQLIWNQMDTVRLVSNKSENGKYNLISVWFNKILRKNSLRVQFWIWNSKQTLSVWFQINRCMVNSIWFRFDLIIFRKYFSVCNFFNLATLLVN